MSEKRQPKYQTGDKVKLIVGGPDMAVIAPYIHYGKKDFTGSYKCQWFAGKKLDDGIFEEENLVLVNHNSEPLIKK